MMKNFSHFKFTKKNTILNNSKSEKKEGNNLFLKEQDYSRIFLQILNSNKLFNNENSQQEEEHKIRVKKNYIKNISILDNEELKLNLSYQRNNQNKGKVSQSPNKNIAINHIIKVKTIDELIEEEKAQERIIKNKSKIYKQKQIKDLIKYNLDLKLGNKYSQLIIRDKSNNDKKDDINLNNSNKKSQIYLKKSNKKEEAYNFIMKSQYKTKYGLRKSSNLINIINHSMTRNLKNSHSKKSKNLKIKISDNNSYKTVALNNSNSNKIMERKINKINTINKFSFLNSEKKSKRVLKIYNPDKYIDKEKNNDNNNITIAINKSSKIKNKFMPKIKKTELNDIKVNKKEVIYIKLRKNNVLLTANKNNNNNNFDIIKNGVGPSKKKLLMYLKDFNSNSSEYNTKTFNMQSSKLIDRIRTIKKLNLNK